MKRMMRLTAMFALVAALFTSEPILVSAGSARTISLGEVVAESASATDEYYSQAYHEYYFDTFKFTVTDKGRFTFEIKASDSSLITLAKFRIYKEGSYGDVVSFIVSPEYDAERGNYVGYYDGGGYYQTILESGTYCFETQYDPTTATDNPYEFKIDVKSTATKVNATSITKLTAKSKGFKVEWKKNDSSGYQIQYATDKNFKSGKKTVTISNSKTVKKTISKLKSGKKYYVRVRVYKATGGTKNYSSWSKTKTVTTK